jgi:WD40-like Beta Propeller Repeat
MGETHTPGPVGGRAARRARTGVAIAAAGACLLVCLPSVAHAAGLEIYYDSQRSAPAGQPGIWMMNADGSGQQGFVPGGSEASWSQDGTKMIYLAAASSPHCLNNGVTGGAIEMVGPDGQNPIQLGGACGDARISPDGTHVAYESAPDSLSVLSVSNPNSPTLLVPVPSGSQKAIACEGALPSTRVTACSFATEPSWLGSSTVVYSDDTSEGGGLWSYPAGGAASPTQVADDNSASGINYGISGESVSPNGTEVAISTNLDSVTNAPESIMVIPVGGSTGPFIATAPANHNYVFPQWSPDGSTIVFEDDNLLSSTSTIDSVPAGGGAVTVLTPNDTTARNPAFGPAQSTHKLTITTLDDQLNAIPDENVQVVGVGQNTTVSTGPAGTVTLDEAPGSYTVEPVPAGGAFTPVKSPDCTVQGPVCAVNLDQDRSVTFQAARDKLEFHFSPSSLAADGLKAYSGEVDDLDSTGNPVSGVSLKFTPPVETPKALVCSATGLLYPQLLGSSIVFHPFRSITQAGKVQFTVHLGTEPGSWLLDAIELNKQVPAMGSIDLPFTPAARRLQADISQRIYDILLNLPTGTRQEILHLSGQPAADQAVLLAFLGTELGALPDFGPIHTTDHAAVEFYDATGATAVLDTQIADEIADAALNRAPLPSGAIHLPTLSQYEATAGVTTQGTLTPQPDGELTYFGFPYPPLTSTGETDATFDDQCLRPDALYFHVEVHSPVRLLFTDRHGQRFGLSASGQAVRGGAGLLLTDRRHHTTMFVLPAGAYHVALSGTGAGAATIVAFTAGRERMRGQVVRFPVRKGQTGAATLGPGGLGITVTFGRHRYRVSMGLGLRIHVEPRRVHHGRGTSPGRIVVTDQFGRPVPSATVTLLRGRTTLANVLTDGRGVAIVLVPRAKKGRLRIRVTAPAARTTSATLTIF